MKVILEEEEKGNEEEGHQEKQLYLDCINVMCVYTVSVCDTRTYTLYNIIKEKVTPDSIVYTDAYHSYNILDVSDFQHYRINHATEFAKDKHHINGIENFWSQAKRHLRIYNGIPKEHVDLYLKECEWRFNYRPIDRMREVLYTWSKEALVHF